MSKDPNQWSLCCLNMLDRTSCVFVTGVVLVAWQRCRWVCYVGCEPTFERDWFLYLFLRPSHDVWLWRDILHKNQLMLCIPQMVKENHASINHYGPPTLAPYFVKNCASQKSFYYPKTRWSLCLLALSGFLDRDVEHIFVLILICVREPKHWVATPQVASPQAYGETTSYVCPKTWFTKGRFPLFLNKLPGFVWNMSR